MPKPPTSSGHRRLKTRVKTARRRSASSARWLERQLNDPYVHRAKREGYRSRAAYKLIELDDKFRFLKPGRRVLDLGAAPGSWTLYVSKEVGAAGRVLAVDLSEIAGGLPGNVSARQLDVMTAGRAELGDLAPYHVVLSDMAPRTSGARSADQYRSYELYMRALELASAVLVPGGNFVGKIFQGAELEEARAATRRAFEEVRILKPDASRAESYEIFLVGRGLRSAT